MVVLWHEGRAWAVEDRCPHLGFPLHQGTVEAGLLTCHWHHARFDLASGCTLDPWADDARGFDVAVEGDDVVVVGPRRGRAGRAVAPPARRTASSRGSRSSPPRPPSACSSSRGGADEVVRTALDFGLTNRRDGWGSGLTVLVAMANVLPHLDPDDRPLALVHALAFVARDTLGNPPRFPIEALEPSGVPAERLAAWYRRFVDTRSVDAAERTLATAVAAGPDGAAAAEAMKLAAATDHVFIDEGHTLDFTNKAFEALAYAHPEQASTVLTSLVAQTCRADRAEESSEWQHPVDLVGLVERATPLLLAAARQGRRGHVRATSAPSAGRCWRTIPRPSSRPSSGPPPAGPRPSSWAGRSPSRRPCASSASTSRTTTATGTRSTTPSPPPTACTRRSPASRRPSCCGACSTGPCASTSTGS